MTIRLKLLIASVVTLLLAVWLVIYAVGRQARLGFAQLEARQRTAVQRQFDREFQRRGQELVHAGDALARSESVLQMAAELSQPQPDLSRYVTLASTIASERGLEYFEIFSADGTLLSSVQRQARYGYKEAWPPSASGGAPFLKREDLLEGPALSLSVVRPVILDAVRAYIVAGAKLDDAFVRSLALPEGARLALYLNLDAQGSQPVDATLKPLIEQVRSSKLTVEEDIHFPDHAERFQARPQFGRDGQLLAVVLIGSSQRELEALERTLSAAGLAGGGAALLLGLAVSAWSTVRISRPLKRIAATAHKLAGGDWAIALPPDGPDEVGQLAASFRNMTAQLREQRERLVQSERVAAWRELARRLAHELKNPLFPLQLTVENLQRARSQPAADFDEVFNESTELLQAELRNLKQIVAQFNDFAKMPLPQLQHISLNDVVRRAARLVEPSAEQASVRLELNLDEALPSIDADPELLHRVIQNLALNALDAMPHGGSLTLRTHREFERAGIDVADTGQGLTPEEQQRLFTPYYTTKQHGTGLGLAIVQSVISDHGGSISVRSTHGTGTVFSISLPLSHTQQEEPAPHGSDTSRR